ncbi:ABC transporter permease [Cognaticolwellia mytili]|uniref:ABC transporter permease n=1 Tax=Cognaticolwellia mytili TaxID=1888913 RepID=UPI000A17262C|nr:ABC transporter permease [Cognaticolwellia mytili]
MIIQDINYAFRLLSKKPAFTVLTTLVMAVGIGVSVYMFSFFNTILYKDLPFEDGASLVVINASVNGTHDNEKLSLHDFNEIKNNVNGLSEFSSYYNTDVIVSSKDGARRFPAIISEPNMFALTRVKPLLGRSYNQAESNAGAEKVVVIGYDIWQNQFAGNDNVIDKLMRLNGENYRVIGVMPEDYFFPNIAQLWLPNTENVAQISRKDANSVHGLAHIVDGNSIADIDGQLNLVMQRIKQQYPETNNGLSAYAVSIPGSGASDGQPVIYTMHIVAILILILASINVGNLLLSRAVERSKETAIRVALGAPRSRLISQMLWESIIICSLGGIIGLLVMAWGLEVTETIVATFFTDPPAFWWKFGLDSYTITLFFIIVFSTIIVTGLLPAWKNSGGDFNAVLRDGTRGALSKKSGRVNKMLVISEIFISMTVLIAAAVMVFASYTQSRADIGAETKNILNASVVLPNSKYPSEQEQVQFVKTLTSLIENSTGIGEVIIASALPGNFSYETSFAIDGFEYTEQSALSYPVMNYVAVMPGSLDKLGVELKQGRYFNSGDDGLDKKSVIVTESFAIKYFNETSAIGKRVRTVSSDNNIDWLTIVGVVETTLHGERETQNFPSVYRPFTQAPRNKLTIAMKMTASQALATKTLRKTMASIDAELPSFKIETYQQSVERITAPITFISNLTALFALAAVVLAASGIYGVMSNTINQRTHEIGIKRALGADEQLITKEFLLAGLKLLLWGGIPGLLAGGFMGFGMSQMFGTDHSVLIIIATLMTILVGSVVLLATYLPTQRALIVEPSQALHYQ